MTQKTVHALATGAGVLGILAAAGPQLGLPPYVVAVVGVVISMLTYVANQLPALGASTPVPPAPPPSTITIVGTPPTT